MDWEEDLEEGGNAKEATEAQRRLIRQLKDQEQERRKGEERECEGQSHLTTCGVFISAAAVGPDWK